MKNPFLILLMLFSALAIGQQRLNFTYDEAGNQSLRTLAFARSEAKEMIAKKIEDLKENDLQKFFPEDVISFYPNPVRDELYLKWENVNENTVKQIDVFNQNGQLIQSFNRFNSDNSLNINFSNYALGVFFVHLNYANGENKSIKIIKQ